MNEKKLQDADLEETDHSKKDYLNVYIPVKNRQTALNRCLKQLDKSKKLFDKIIVIDACSDNPIKIPKKYQNVILERTEFPIWNKAWVLNTLILRYPNKYVMTLDVDMLVSKEHLRKINKNLSVNNFICDTNVRRINKDKIEESYDNMIKNSKPWRNQDTTQYLNTANGGFQVYSYDFFVHINGIQEGLGLYHGSVDNIMYYRARMNNLNIVDISYPLLHVEHSNQKENNYEEAERVVAGEYRQFKAAYLNHVIKNNLNKNTENIGGDKPNMELFSEYKNMKYNSQEIINKAIKEGKEFVELGYQTFRLEKAKPKIMVAVINNYGSYPDYFVWDMFNLWRHTASQGYDVELCPINACEVNSMRNIAIKMAIGQLGDKKYDYLVMLDDDHAYPPEFIVDFIEKMQKNKWSILTGLTSRKKSPWSSTQYYKLKDNITEVSNCVKCPKPKKEVIQIEASGPVGMVMDTKIFKELKWPYYEMDFSPKIIDGKKSDGMVGSDIVFCKKLKEKNIPIMLDLSVSFPHEVKMMVNRGRVIESQ